MPKMTEGSPFSTRSRWRRSSCVRGSAFCTSTTLRMAVGNASTAWRICSREVNNTSAPYSTRAMSCSSASTISVVNCAAFLGSARVSAAISVPCAA